MKLEIIVMGLILFTAAPELWADAPSVEDRLKSLEDTQQELSDSLASQGTPVDKLFSDRFRLGGYFVMEGESLYQPQQNKLDASFTQAEFRPLALVQFTKDWSGLAEFAILGASEIENPDSSLRKFGTFQTFSEFDRAYVDYTGFKGVRVRVGDFFTPFGYSNIEHSESLLITNDQPLFILNNLFTSNVGGVSLYGEGLFPLNWEVYAGSEINSDFGEASISGPTAGGRLTYTLPWEREWVLGASYENFRDTNSLENVSAYGLDLRADWNIFSLLVETTATNHNGFGVYAVPAVRFGQWLFFYAYDSVRSDLDSYSDSNNPGAPVDAKSQNILGVNYLVTGHLRLKFQIARVGYQNETDLNGESKNYFLTSSQIGFSF